MSAFGVPACTGDAPQGIAPVPFKVACSAKGCEGRVQVGMFFDGTGNNLKDDTPKLSHSNVARLSNAYPDLPQMGIYRNYIEGVGTPCPRVGEAKAHPFGGGFSAGGKARMCLGLIELFNSVYEYIVNRELILDKQRLALCRNDRASVNISSEDNKALASIEFNGVKLGQDKNGGLLSDGVRMHFIKKAVAEIKRVAKENDSPKLKEVVIDLFGFSRGAAEARAFQNWLLNEVFEGDTLFGVPAMIRFMGIFDSVASVGPQLGAAGFVTGHMEWADSNLRISPKVKKCVHFVAMHENRNSFPLDSVRVGTSLPGNCIEIAYPGMHSDVGGGYAPGDQGKPDVGTVTSKQALDALKLSQLALNHMYEAAQAASVPLISRSAGGIKADFDVDSRLIERYRHFYNSLPNKSMRLNEYLDDYLAVRVQRTNLQLDDKSPSFLTSVSPPASLLESQLSKLSSMDEDVPLFKNAKGKDLVYLRVGQHDIAREPMGKKARYLAIHERLPASYVFEIEALVADYMHDSMAGFMKDLKVMIEPTGYLHPRKVFAGDE